MAVQFRSFDTSGNGSSPRSVPQPAGVASGDLLLLHVSSNSNVAPTSVPSGFTLVDSIGTAPTIYVYAKTAGGSEPATYDVSWASGTHNAAVSAFYSDTGVALIVDVHANQTNTSADRNLPSIDTTIVNTLLVGLASTGTNVSTTPAASLSERYDVGTGPRLWMATEAIAAVGATGTRTQSGTDATNNVVALAIAQDPEDVATGGLTMGAPTVGTPALGQVHVLAAMGIATGAPTVGAPVLEERGDLEAPTDLTATASSTGQIDLAWGDNNIDESGFQIQRSPDGVSGWELIHTNASNDLTYTDTGLEPATQYFYRVRALKS